MICPQLKSASKVKSNVERIPLLTALYVLHYTLVPSYLMSDWLKPSCVLSQHYAPVTAPSPDY